ncbi:hypothetical protein B0H14DRAFT_3437656 [Mycena olivaceomarginata]|nr:hypothetical protein B0H14DRAFT_3437656 [Mycena olivaceomarginata]
MSTYTSQSQVEQLTNAFGIENVTASDFVLTLLERDSLQANPCTQSLLDNTGRIIEAFSRNSGSASSTYAWARKAIQKSTIQAIRILTANNDWHFNAEHASAADLEDFKIEEMAATMKKLAPDLWTLLQILLSRDVIDVDGAQVMDDLGSDADEFDESGEFASMGKNGKQKRRESIRNIKTAVILSIMMQSRNSKCNALESVFVIFLHSTNTHEKVIEALSHMGISISQTAIHRAIHSLSAETAETLCDLGQTLLVGYAYDNFNINFPTLVPTVEKAAHPLTHLTSGAVICLEHGVVIEDLECSEELWQKSPLNRGRGPPGWTRDFFEPKNK